MVSEWKSNALSLVSIAFAMLAFINKEDRLWASAVFAGTIVFYIIKSFSEDMEGYGESIKKLEERLNIHNQLIGLKSDVEYLKQQMVRKK